MAGDEEHTNEHSQLLPHNKQPGTVSARPQSDAESILSSHLSRDELALGNTVIGERLAYNDYTTIDWLHDLVKDSFRNRSVHGRKGLRYSFLSAWDSCQGWVAAALIGILTACVAFVVDISAATVGDWKTGYCASNVFASRENCRAWKSWTENFWHKFGVYVGFALLYGIISGGVTMATKETLPAAAPGQGDKFQNSGRAVGIQNGNVNDEARGTLDVQAPVGKSMYMAAGSGIPEIKTILSGFVIPHFLDFKVLVVKAVGSVFAVSTGMCLGKEGPFVHISACVSHLVAIRFPKYRDNSRKLREILSAGVASGLSVAFGAPIGGVLFAYEEISTYFPRKVLWRAFICSLFAAMALKALNPTGTGKLVLFETNYATTYEASHYLIFVALGIAGGVFGGIFCKANFWWSRTFRKYTIIRNSPVFEVFLVVLVTALIQYPNTLMREPGDIIIKNLLVDCGGESKGSWVCKHESSTENSKYIYIGWLVYGTLVKLILTIATFGIKVPSGIIIPALDGGAFFGRLLGQLVPSISPGIFAMVGAGAFLAGVSRMTISLAVIMFELTGELEFIVPNMIGIMVAKWIADALQKEGVYDLAQTVLGHPFLDADHAMQLVQAESHNVEELIPPEQTMKEITVDVPPINRVRRKVLEEKLSQLKRRGLMDAGLVLVQNGMLQGYLAEGELEFGLSELRKLHHEGALVRLLGNAEQEEEFDMTSFVDRTPLTLCAKAPMEYAVEMFGKLGLRYLCVVEEGSGKLVGVIIKKRLVAWLESLKE